MAREKSKDIRLLKITGKVTDTRSVTMAYVLYELDIIRTKSEVTITSIISPIVKKTHPKATLSLMISSPQGLPPRQICLKKRE